jgi:hypothetical protein
MVTARVTHIIRWGSQGSDTDELDRFVQTRIALYTLLIGGLFALLYVAGAIAIAVAAREQWLFVHLHPAKIMNLVLAVLLLAVSRYLRQPTRSLPSWQLRAIDLGSALSISIACGVGAATAPANYQLQVGALLIVVLMLVVRSAIVPSTAAFTVLVSMLCWVPVVVGGYMQAKAASPGALGFVTPELLTVGLSVWCVAATTGTATVSRTIYGLVAQVRQAMHLGRYTLREKIGEGGMGAVYRAEHAMLRRATAIKLLLPDRVNPSALARFEREVQLTSQLCHPNTIAIHDYGKTPDGVFYYAMELIEGRSLQQLLVEEGPQPAGRVVHVLLQAAGSLREAHGVGLIHRDIKPGNLLIGTRAGISDFVKVIDFGLAKQLEPQADMFVTRTDALAGTPLFMAPETILRPDRVDGKVDTYALGALAYMLITGVPPFAGASVVEVCSHHLQTQPVPPSQRGVNVPMDLEAVILQCLAKEPALRPDDEELIQLLRGCQQTSPWGDSLPSGVMQPRAAARATL